MRHHWARPSGEEPISQPCSTCDDPEWCAEIEQCQQVKDMLQRWTRAHPATGRVREARREDA
jgi:hypothetical protein